MPIPDEFKIAPDFAICDYCGESYADTAENMRRVLIEKDGDRRVFVACVHCIAKAKTEPAYEEYITNKTFNEKLGRRFKNVNISP